MVSGSVRLHVTTRIQLRECRQVGRSDAAAEEELECRVFSGVLHEEKAIIIKG
jgi:hypothetical protein